MRVETNEEVTPVTKFLAILIVDARSLRADMTAETDGKTGGTKTTKTEDDTGRVEGAIMIEAEKADAAVTGATTTDLTSPNTSTGDRGRVLGRAIVDVVVIVATMTEEERRRNTEIKEERDRGIEEDLIPDLGHRHLVLDRAIEPHVIDHLEIGAENTSKQAKRNARPKSRS